ncbi:hypothetical protein [Aestuariivirga sp.]|uniref:hypothetical protein n=1 Tax=Aestuariivirga sp. TaxID=2650926 RepID=UPI003BAB8070
MARKAKKKSTAKVPTKSRKTKKAIAVKSAPKARKTAPKKAPRKATRRSAADVAKLRKAVLAGAKAGKTADAVAAELGISKAYVYALKNRA